MISKKVVIKLSKEVQIVEAKKQHGGYRSGAGRKASLPEGARFRGINLTDEEFKAVKELVAKMRNSQQRAVEA